MGTNLLTHWKESKLSIPEYVDWLDREIGNSISPLSMQSNPSRYRVTYWKTQKRKGGGIRQYLADRKLTNKETALFEAIYQRFNRYYAFFTLRHSGRSTLRY